MSSIAARFASSWSAARFAIKTGSDVSKVSMIFMPCVRSVLPVSVTSTIASTIERHHNTDADGEAAFVRLADMLAHYEQGAPVSPAEMLRTARTIGLGPAELRSVMYELPSAPSQRRRHVDPCPLSVRELSVLQYLPSMMTYPEIADQLFVSVNTVKSHLRHLYAKLEVINRRQAVIRARARGLLDP